MLEYFIRNDRKYRYYLMCSITSHYRQKSTYVDDTSNAVGRSMPDNATTTALKPLGETLNFNDCWLKQYQQKYQEILIIYHDAIIELFKQVSTMKYKPISQDKNHQLVLSDIDGTWYMRQISKELRPLKNKS